MKQICLTNKILILNEKGLKYTAIPNELLKMLDKLNNERFILVGYRTGCSNKMDNTYQFFNKIWLNACIEIKKQRFDLKIEKQKVENRRASLSGGFWEEYIFGIN